MRYLGSKIKLLDAIEKTIIKYNIQGKTFADLFAGTGCVGDYFKDRYTIQSNDFLYFSYVMNQAKLKNSNVPSFKKFKKAYDKDIFTWLNSQEFEADSTYFVYNNYTPIGGRMFFTEENGLKIDGIRLKIEDLYQNRTINEDEYYFLLASLIESVTKVSNTSGTYEAFFKFWDTRATKAFVIEPLEINKVKLFSKNEVYNKETNSLIKELSGDIAYIDPPYTVTQYVSAYHMFETIARYDSPEITGKGGKRDRGNKNSLYAQRTKALTAFEDLFRKIKYTHILVSYSNQGLVSLDDLISLAKHFAKDKQVYVESTTYREYQNHRSSNKGNGKNLNEVIIYFQKDITLNKSPLNYSGSKDTLVPFIINELPDKVGTFVDVMGGAFNVGVNISALTAVVYNELNPYVYNTIEWLLNNDKDKIINQIELAISSYGLEKGNKDAYNKLRSDFNAGMNSPLYLYLLHMYSFQNMIRFNSRHEFNTPIGVAGYSEDIKHRILHFYAKTENVKLLNTDYTTLNWNEYPIDTVFYFDPPYFITSAAYNDGKRGMKGWTADEEVELLNILNYLDAQGYKFMLSNVIYHKGRVNHLLLKWVQEHQFTIVNIGTSGLRYTKKEVIIKNF
ncbi:Dam family site-specific DNA-(adenine-N6)-methyltransferase [Thomasclavelia cocleata]|uniref:Dam family site-specific DNA-(adenine-N6)-methyltransferase n=1 Tax=Thomasclavelia cocleata TaxID=69824 RepID=UPI0025701EF4|nr:Dam family site-specific DNA-(adenine-N6)-methyltransferase [Thomasclavelia cocleata]